MIQSSNLAITTAKPLTTPVPTAKLEKSVVVADAKPLAPRESVNLTAAPVAEGTAIPVVTPEVSTEPIPTSTPVPSTLAMELPEEVGGTEPAEGPVQTMTRSLMAKSSSDAHWEAGLEALNKLPEEDREAAGKRGYYTMAAMLPEFAETLAGLPPDQQPMFDQMLHGAKEAGAIDGNWLDGLVKDWQAKNPEQAYQAQMSGFASYANEQLGTAAQEQGIENMAGFKIGPREQALIDVSNHGHSFVVDRSAYLDGVYSLFNSGQHELAQQVLDA